LIWLREQWRALVKTVMKFLVLYNFGKILSASPTGGFSRWAQLRGVSLFNQFSFWRNFWKTKDELNNLVKEF
jgi:hypothetical protein